MGSSLNIILFGETGVGKSSVINLIAERGIASTSPDAQGCTLSFTPYTLDVSGRTLNIWDTVGLDGPEMEGSSHADATEQACELIHQLASQGGVDLLLFCIRGGRVTPIMKNNYKLFYEVLCGSKVPISLVITNLEQEAKMEDWMARNQDDLQKHGIKFANYACVTGLPDHPKYEESQANIKKLLEGQNAKGRFAMPSENWHLEFFRQLRHSPLKIELKGKELVKVLMESGKLDKKRAEEVAAKLERGDTASETSRMSSSLNIVLFGETGVGKSSVVNLIADREIAQTSPDAQGCTMSFRPYNFDISGRTLNIWDTVGLEEPRLGASSYLHAIEQARELIHQLTNEGGVDLLLFCIRGSRATATTQSNYRLFYEVLGRSKVPISLVITNLEQEVNMADWWIRNQAELQKYGIKCAGHACVTGLPGNSKYGESRANIQKLLEGRNSDRRFTMPPDKWYIEFLRLFGLFAPPKVSKRKDIVKVLTKRCGLDEKIAEEVADKLVGGCATGSSA